MKRLMAAALLLSFIGVYLTTSTVYLSGVHGASPRQNLEGNIGRNQAIKIAQQHALETNIDPAR